MGRAVGSADEKKHTNGDDEDARIGSWDDKMKMNEEDENR